MPTYDYRCHSCGHELEIFHSMSDKPRRKCPACGKLHLERQIGSGAAVIFKGSGFYETDYRSESYKQGEKAARESQKPKPDTKEKSKTDASTTGADKSESKNGSKSSPKKPGKSSNDKS